MGELMSTKLPDSRPAFHTFARRPLSSGRPRKVSLELTLWVEAWRPRQCIYTYISVYVYLETPVIYMYIHT